MELTKYREEIRKASEGEVIGEALFLRLAPAFAPEHHDKLIAMAKLETVTGGLLEALVARHGIEGTDRTTLAGTTESLAASLEGVSWQELMTRLSNGFRPYVAIYDRLEEHARPEDRHALAFLARHERLLLEFVEAELAGDGTTVLEKIDALVAGKASSVSPGGEFGQESEKP
ncbi:hypothetical protein [Nitratireductor sp. GCM10026969]|uniref:hypothetical protein n=1 Tax=Nitratireductor sp. GCM10026969 TaxID=3252645 RepID=UPI00360C842B